MRCTDTSPSWLLDCSLSFSVVNHLLTRYSLYLRHRHLLNDLSSLLPHGRKDAKFDSKSKLYQLNELAELYNCNNVLFFEARKGQDLYVWLSKVPNGPTVKMHLQNCTYLDVCHDKTAAKTKGGMINMKD